MNLFLVRHGESTANIQNDLYSTIPDNKIELTPLGEKQAKNLAEEMQNIVPQICTMYYSPWVRAEQTFEILKTKYPEAICRESPIIYEQAYTQNFEHMKHVAFVPYTCPTSMSYGSFWYKVNDRETFAEVYNRALTFWNHLRLSHTKDENIVIVSHGQFLLIFEMVVKQLTIKDFEKLKHLHNCEIRNIDLRNL